MYEIAHIIRVLAARRRIVVTIGLISLLLGLASVFRFHASPPFLSKRSSAYGVGRVDVVVDSKQSTLTNAAKDVTTLTARAAVYARFISVPEVRNVIADRLGASPKSVATQAVDPNPAMPAAPQASATVSGPGLSVVATPQSDGPVITLSTTGPTADAARRLADASAGALASYVQHMPGGRVKGTATTASTTSPGVDVPLGPNKLLIRRLGPAVAGGVVTGASLTRMPLIAFVSFIAGIIILLFCIALRRELRTDHARPRRDPHLAEPGVPVS